MIRKSKQTARFMKRWITVALSASMIVTTFPNGSLFGTQAKNVKADTAEEEVVVYQSDNASGKKVKNIIYMIPDGGGYPSYDLTKKVKELGGMNNTGTKQTANKMYMDEYWVASETTRSLNNSVTDSSAAGTALATGHKTNNDYTGVDKDYKPMANILEVAELEGKATGIVETSYEYDATPAAFSAHTKSRTDYDEIIPQEMYTGLEVMLGGGISYSNYTKNNNTSMATSLGYQLVGTKSDLMRAASNADENTKLWGTFNAGDHHMPYEIGYNGTYDGVSSNDTPTLAEMTQATIDVLSKDPDGFCMMVEGSKIDYACHHANAQEIVGDYIAFDEAFKVAVDYAKEHGDTVVVALPDHNTGLECGYDYNWNDIANQVRNGGKPGLPTTGKDGSEYPHTGANVGVWMYLPDGVEPMAGTQPGGTVADRDQYVIDNSDVAPYLASLISDRTMDDATSELYVDVSDMASCNNGYINFNDYDARAKVNSDEATIKGQDVDLDGQLCLNLNGKSYVPMSMLKQLGVNMEVVSEENIKGKGTKEDPYLISNRAQFLKFTNSIIGGETYKDQYVKQTASFDMTGIKDYAGMTSANSFAGTYDGQGYVITADISAASEKGVALFPNVQGTVKNLGVEGSFYNGSTTGACASIAAKVSGKVVNCWSTADISSKQDGAGIAADVTGNVYNCFYKGKNTAATNCGVAKVNGGKVEYCAYEMKAGSSNVAGNNAGGSVATDFKAATLNSKHADTVKALGMESVDELCHFADVAGYDFIFAGTIAKMTKLTYTYTDKQTGKEVTEPISGFNMDELGYNVVIGDKMDGNQPITLSGEALDMGDTCENVITVGSKQTDAKGFATIELALTAVAKTAYYETTATAKYNSNFTGSAPYEVIATATPTVVPTATPTMKPTATPEIFIPVYATEDPATEAPTATPIITATPTAIATTVPTQVPTIAPTVSATAIAATAVPQVDLSNCKIMLESTKYTFKNKKIKPEAIISYGTAPLVVGRDYTISYKNNVNAGKAKVVIVGIGNYTGSVTAKFTITQKSIVSLSCSKNAKKRTVAFKLGSYKLKSKKDYTISVKKTGSKSCILTVKGKGNFKGKRRFAFK